MNDTHFEAKNKSIEEIVESLRLLDALNAKRGCMVNGRLGKKPLNDPIRSRLTEDRGVLEAGCSIA
jgi:hypothetical protein